MRENFGFYDTVKQKQKQKMLRYFPIKLNVYLLV